MKKLLIFVSLLLCVTAFAEEDDAAPTPSTNRGMAVDKNGGPVVDPTANVLALVKAAVQRLDDLRSSENRRIDDLRALESSRIDQLRAAESRRSDELAKLRSEFEDRLALAESSRINAIRAVDVGNVAIANERATAAATVLANQVTTSADTLRALVSSTAASMATSTTDLTKRFDDRLSALEKGSYQSTGRASLADPQLADLISEMRAISRSTAVGAGKTEGISASYAVLIGVAGLILAFLAARRFPS